MTGRPKVRAQRLVEFEAALLAADHYALRAARNRRVRQAGSQAALEGDFCAGKVYADGSMGAAQYLRRIQSDSAVQRLEPNHSLVDFRKLAHRIVGSALNLAVVREATGSG